MKNKKAIEQGNSSTEGQKFEIECGFCSWIGDEKKLLKNGHCPNCQSPSTIKDFQEKNKGKTMRHKNGTVTLPENYEGVDG